MIMKLRRATEADSQFVAQAVLIATRAHLRKGWFDILLGDRKHECLPFIERLTCTAARSWWHYSRFWVAETQGTPAAALCCFKAGEGYPLSGEAFTEAAAGMNWDSDEQKRMWERGSYIFSCAVGGGDAVWTLENIATMPEYRRLGLTTMLIEQAVAEGRQEGCERMQVATLIGNEPAIEAYKAFGFRLAEEKRSETFAAAMGSPGMCRFEIAL